MQGIKNMLLGIAIMLAVIVFHLFYAKTHIGLWTDFVAIIGFILVIKGYNTKDHERKDKPTE